MAMPLYGEGPYNGGAYAGPPGGVYVDDVHLPYRKGSLKVSDMLEARSTGSIVFVDVDGTLQLQRGNVIDARLGVNGEHRVFHGMIFDVGTAKPGVGTSSPTRYLPVKLVDWHYLADKRRVAKTYVLQTCGAIVRDIIGSYLTDEGVTAGIIEEGPVVTETVINYARASEAIAELAKQADFWWIIDRDKRLHFRSRAAVPAPWVLSYGDGEESIIKGSIKLDDSNPSYRNRQYLRGGYALTSTQSESYKGDGETQSFPTAYPIGKVPGVKVNGVSKTVGIRGVETGKDWYWNKNDPIISQELSAAALSTTDTLEITYQGLFPVIALAQDHHEIAARKAAEGGTGYVDDVVDDPRISSHDVALAVASSWLKKYASLGRTLSFKTRRGGLAPGQLLTCDLEYHDLVDVQMLIVQIETAGDFYEPEFTVTAVEGPNQGSWHQLFAEMARSRVGDLIDRVNVGEADTLLVLQQFDETWSWSETVTQTVFACPVPSATLFPSESLLPC